MLDVSTIQWFHDIIYTQNLEFPLLNNLCFWFLVLTLYAPRTIWEGNMTSSEAYMTSQMAFMTSSFNRNHNAIICLWEFIRRKLQKWCRALKTFRCAHQFSWREGEEKGLRIGVLAQINNCPKVGHMDNMGEVQTFSGVKNYQQTRWFCSNFSRISKRGGSKNEAKLRIVYRENLKNPKKKIRQIVEKASKRGSKSGNFAKLH